VPSTRNKVKIEKYKNKSLILLTIIAFIADLFACKRVNQKLISKYEDRPTPSQPKNICKKLPAVTKSNIKKVKIDK
jgi:hypothetical protein